MFSDPQFWVAVAFFAFIAAIFNPVRKILFSNLDNQIKQIKESISEAENLKNEAQLALSEIKQRQNDVKKEIDDIHSDAKNKIEQIKKNNELKLKNQIDKRQSLATSKIDQLTRDANNEIQEYISTIAIDATIDLLKEKLSEAQKQNLIDSSVKEINSVLKS